MASRFTTEQEDAYRLPEGFKRIGYDADTRRYRFRDAHGALYQSEPGVEYGTLTPIAPVNSAMEQVRPGAFASSSTHTSRSATLRPAQSAHQTFQDFLPPELITSSTLSGKSTDRSQTSSKASHDKFVNTVKKAGLPKMQGVVNNLRRSMTSMRKPRGETYTQISGEDGHRLGHRDYTSTAASGLERPSLDSLDSRDSKDAEKLMLGRH